MSGRRRVVALLLLGAAGVAGICVAIAFGAVNLSATSRPSRLEKTVAHAVLDASVRARAPRGKSAPADAASVAQGREAYRANCLVCHGVPGGEQSAVAAGLNPPVPDLSEPETQGRSDGEIYFLVSGGVRLTGMPGFEKSLPEKTRWELVGFLRTLPKLGEAELQAISGR